MTGNLMVLQCVTIGGTVLACMALVAALAVSVASEFRRGPAVHWQPAGPTYPRTLTTAELQATLTLGMTPAAVEAEIRELARGREQPA